MRTILVIGIGMGNPEQVTLEAIRAMNRADVFFVVDKGPAAAELNRLRAAILARHVAHPHRIVTIDDPPRDRAASDYAGAVGDWHAARDSVRRLLSQFGTLGIGETLGGVIESLPSLAAELGKPAPVVHIDSHGHRVRSEIAATLKNVFMHLLRNSVDHGIETSDERRAAGKAPAGTIDIAVDVGNGALRFVLGDDGRGLALDRIRGIARERGWIDDDNETALSDEAVAALIFRPGFSTAHAVTEVSGRGVGMDAVRNFLTRDGGDIALRFTDDCVGAAYRAFQTVVSLPERFAANGSAHEAAHVSAGVANADAAE